MKRRQYKYLPFFSILILFLGLTSLPDFSHAQNNRTIKISSDVDSEVVERFTESSAERIITSRSKSVDLVISNKGVAIQFTDDFLNDLEGEIRDSENKGDESSKIEKIILSMASSGVRALLDHAIVIPFHEISDVSYHERRIIITDISGQELFGELEINNQLVVEDFSRRDARRFVADAEKRLI